MNNKSKNPLVSVIMGSKSDLDTMRLSSEVLRELNIPHETKIISAHRTPEAMFNFARKAKEKGIKIISQALYVSRLNILLAEIYRYN